MPRSFVLSALLALAACSIGPHGQTAGPPVARANEYGFVSRVHRESTPSYRVVYTFQGDPDAIGSRSELRARNGILYGTSSLGGSKDFGSLFEVSPTGQERVLNSFDGSNGRLPSSGLIALNDHFWGLTEIGGSSSCAARVGCGVIFYRSSSSALHVAYRFNGNEGNKPSGDLIALGSALYGTTLEGGGYYGTVFSLNSSGTLNILHRFHSGTDGETPNGGLVELNGSLWGTTQTGGAHGLGTVFAVDPSGAYKIVYNFQGGTDGASPVAALIVANGVLYGTTQVGGTGCSGYGCGTVFSITTSGQEKVLYKFLGGNGSASASADGRWPSGRLLFLNGDLFGTTEYAGPSNSGVIFSVSASTGQETILYAFQGKADGGVPSAGLTFLRGSLYGTTGAGGGACGCGTVFAISP